MLKPAHTYMQQHKTKDEKHTQVEQSRWVREGAIEGRIMSQVKDDGFNDTPVFVSHSPEWFLSNGLQTTNIQMHLSTYKRTQTNLKLNEKKTYTNIYTIVNTHTHTDKLAFSTFHVLFLSNRLRQVEE